MGALNTMTRYAIVLGLSLALVGCFSQEPEGIGAAAPAATTVVYDFFAKPLPNIPLPNDLATRYDATSATGRRLNASLVTPTQFNSTVRQLVDQLAFVCVNGCWSENCGRSDQLYSCWLASWVVKE